jgi:hypothetical protein
MSCSVERNRLRTSRTWIRRGSLSLNGASMTGSDGVASLMIGWQSMWDWQCRTRALGALSLQQTQAQSSKLRVAARQQWRESQAAHFCSEKQKNPGRGSRPAGASKRFEGSGVEAAGQRNRIPFCSVIELCNQHFAAKPLARIDRVNYARRIEYDEASFAPRSVDAHQPRDRIRKFHGCIRLRREASTFVAGRHIILSTTPSTPR